MKIVECNRNYSNIIRDALEKAMSWIHSYYALACIDTNICRALIAYEEEPVGVGVFYRVPSTWIGVIYYVAVLPRYRGRGIGRAIVASIEQLLSFEGAEVFIATTRVDNVASRDMLSSLGYIEVFIDDLSDDLREIVRMMTCGYEDDLLYVKLEKISLEEFFSIISRKNTVEVIENLWRSICYSPWARLRRRKT